MTSYAELLKACTEFQENFAILNGKYEAVFQQLKNETERSAHLQKLLEESATKEEKLHQEITFFKREIEELSGYKEKYNTASIALEHMKGRMEAIRRSTGDVALEHDQVVQQLKSQINDLTQRIEVTTSASRQKELTKQITELEERCAAQQSQIISERENFSQRILAAHNALREQQSRNLEYEQRCRSMEGEVTEMRSSLRRSLDLQNEAATLKERYAAEAVLATQSAETARAEADEYRKRLTHYHQEHQKELEEHRRTSEEERHRLRDRVASLTASLQDASSATQKERDKYNHLQRTVQQQVEKARAESTTEITALRRVNSELKEGLQKTQWAMEQLKQELEESRREVEHYENGNHSLTTQLRQVQQNLDDAVQREAWALAEKQHLADELATRQQEIEAFQKAGVEHESTSFELERARLLIKSRDVELQDLRREIDDTAGRMADLEDSAMSRIRTLKKELRQVKRYAREESEKADTIRHQLVRALVQREAESYQSPATRPHCLDASTGKDSFDPHHSTVVGGSTPYTDVMKLLVSQSEEAEKLQNRLLEFSKH